ncbi:MAG: hypothetical protein NC428_00445 [Clostridium sp.]|nr:hypothetical protein [Clostridium sp.]
MTVLKIAAISCLALTPINTRASTIKKLAILIVEMVDMLLARLLCSSLKRAAKLL